MAEASKSKMLLSHYDAVRKKNSENYSTNLYASEVSSDTAAAVVSWARNLVHTLSTDTYDDVVITTTASMNTREGE